MPQGERRLAAIMFTDMVGFTALTQSNEALAMEVLERHNRLLRPFFPKFKGKEVKTIGDSFLVEFDSALDAVRCAFEIQSHLHDFSVSSRDEWKIKLRIGIHLGDVIHQEGDVFGDAVNIASRIEPVAEPEGICVSQQVFDQVRNKFERPLLKLPSKDLKNVQFSLEMYKVEMPWDKPVQTEEVTPYSGNRIAVLPFANYSPDPNDEFFADGITEEIISTVSGISGLNVISRTSIMGYKGTTKRVKEIGRELEVGSVLEGSFRKAGNRIRITTQLIDVTRDRHLWAQSYDREFDDVFAIQSDIARQVADALRVRMLPNEARQLEKRPTKSTEAYALYLKGRYFWNERSKESLLKAVEYFKQAIEIDPEYALAYSGTADCYAVLGENLYIPYDEAFPRAKENALKAVQLDDSSGEAHVSVAQALSFHYDWEGAEREFKKALDLNPNYATGHHWYGILLMNRGSLEESLREALRAQVLDPLSPQISVFCGIVYYGLRKYDLAKVQLRKALDLNPNSLNAHAWLTVTYILEGKYVEAEKEGKEVSRLDPLRRGFLAEVYAFSGRGEEARKILDELNRARSDSYVPIVPMVVAYLGLGEREKAIELIQEEYENRAVWLPAIAIDPLLESVKSDPRVVEILKKIGVSN